MITKNSRIFPLLKMAPTPAQTSPCTPKELELMAKLKTLEEDRVKFVEIVRSKVKKLETELEASIASRNFFLIFMQ